MRSETFLLNGAVTPIEPNKHHLSAAEYIRQFAHCKSVKVGCNEGGCGACAVEVVQRDAATGKESVLAVSSCLVPVGVLAGAEVITAEGLGNSRQGLHQVQARLAGFHGTQCGFCSPGIAISCHAALSVAAASAHKQAAPYNTGNSDQQCQQKIHHSNGHTGSANDELGCASEASGAVANGCNSGDISVAAADLLSALDGNLCRCTGWRPIADMAKSFACDVDIEDLGLNTLDSQQLGPISRQQLLPACMKHKHQQQKQQQGKYSQQQHFNSALNSLQPGSFLIPETLQQLLVSMQAAAAARVPMHLVAGNTGAGLHKQQWQQVAGSVCIVLKQVPELQQLSLIGLTDNSTSSSASTDINSRSVAHRAAASANEMSPDPGTGQHFLHTTGDAVSRIGADGDGSCPEAPHIVAGAGVTLTQLIRTLKHLAADELAAGHQHHNQNLLFLVQHLSRAASTLVRNVATLGGHLMLCKLKHLESDLLPYMIAAGAELEVVSVHGNSCWISVETFLNTHGSSSSRHSNGPDRADLISQLGSTALITAVKLPLPLTSAAVTRTSSSELATSYPRIWSYKLTTHRHANEHAAVNLCCWLDERQHTAASEVMNNDTGSCLYDLRIAIGTYQQSSNSNSNSNSSSSNAEGVWEFRRAAHVEAAVLREMQHYQPGQQSADAVATRVCAVLQRLPELLMTDIHPAGRLASYIRSVAPVLCLKGLAVVLPLQQQDKHQEANGAMLTAVATSGAEVLTSSIGTVTPFLLAELQASAVSALSTSCAPPAGSQDLPVDLDAAPPLYWPTQKDGSTLQVTGEAEYADDTHLAAGALYAAHVTSAQPHAQLLAITWQPALEVDGVVGYVCADDIPAGPTADVSGRTPWSVGDSEPLFAHDTVEHVGQSLGLVLANTHTAARAGAARVVVEYGPILSSNSSSNATKDHTAVDKKTGLVEHEDGGSKLCEPVSSSSASGAVNGGQLIKPVITLADAIAAGSWYDLSKLPNTKASKGDVTAALSSSSRVVRGQLQIGSQRHFYMEPQTAIATPEEGGRMTLISSCQGTDPVLHAVARLLQLKHNQVHVKCNRVGGGFGGKADRAIFTACAAAVAAHKVRRQVRLVVDGGADASMNAGRCPMAVDWSAGLDEQSQLQALKIDVTLVGGAYFTVTGVEAASIAAYLDSVYDFPAFEATVRAVRCHLPPRSTVRGPGKVSATLILEQVLQQVAAAAGHSPEKFREELMIKIPPQAVEAAIAAAAAHEDGVLVDGSCTAIENSDDEVLFKKREQQQDAERPNTKSSSTPVIPHPKYYSTGNDDAGHQREVTLHTTLGKPIPLHTYTLPYMWHYLQETSKYEARKAAVIDFNQQQKLRKRGLALVPVRFSTFQGKKLATVTLYSDGSVLLFHAGTEMGQGIGTKVKQAAAASLGALLPAGEAALLLDYIRIGTASTELMPHAGIAAASTTSEGAAASVAAACDILVKRLRPAADKLAAATAAADSGSKSVGGAALWEKIVSEVAEPIPATCSREVMTATALAGFADDGGGWFSYHAFGVGAAEVEVDCCTGERQLLRADLMFDSGRTVNPAIDLGQVEGAFMMGVGHILHEEVVEDGITGRTVSRSTWEYKPPGIHELPQELNVHLLKDSPVHVPRWKQLSAKAIGEPPMLMSAAIACALQDAIAAAWDDYTKQQQLCAPNGRSISAPVVHADKRETVGVQGVTSIGGIEGLQQPTLQLPATTANIKRALPPMLYHPDLL